VDIAVALRDARRRAGLTQAELGARAGTSQATISAYESGRKQASLATMARLLGASGSRLTVGPAERPVVHLGEDELARAGRGLVEVIGLAEALPTRHERTLRFPPLSITPPGAK